MAETGDDCHYFYYSTCTKGSQCPFRHCAEALGNEKMCQNWFSGYCTTPNCKFRHTKINKARNTECCYWENQPGGCRKPHCVYKHLKQRDNIQGTLPDSAPTTGRSRMVWVNPKLHQNETTTQKVTVSRAIIMPSIETIQSGPSAKMEVTVTASAQLTTGSSDVPSFSERTVIKNSPKRVRMTDLREKLKRKKNRSTSPPPVKLKINLDDLTASFATQKQESLIDELLKIEPSSTNKKPRKIKLKRTWCQNERKDIPLSPDFETTLKSAFGEELMKKFQEEGVDLDFVKK